MNQAEMPAWAKDMQHCRALALQVMMDIKSAMEGRTVINNESEKDSNQKTLLAPEESLTDGLVKVGSFLLRWHAFERGLEDAAFLGDAEGDRPLAQEDEVIMREYLRNAKS